MISVATCKTIDGHIILIHFIELGCVVIEKGQIPIGERFEIGCPADLFIIDGIFGVIDNHKIFLKVRNKDKRVEAKRYLPC